LRFALRDRLLSGAALLGVLVAADAHAQEAAGAASAPEAATSATLAATDAVDATDAVAEVVVTGLRRSLQIDSGPLGSRTILETPFSVGVADAEQITRIAATTIDAAFNYDASIRPNNSGLASGNTFNARGLEVDRTNGYKYDGLAFPYWYQDHPIEAVEQIQVLKGSGGFIYGYASPAGIVNFIPKKPGTEFRTSAGLSFRSSNIWRAHVDIGGPFAEGGTTAFRLNAVHEEGKLYNGADNKNQFLTLWVQGEFTPKLSWSVDGFYQRTWQARQSNNVTIGPSVTSLKPIDGADFDLGALSTTKWNDLAQITGKLTYEFSPDWTATAAIRYSTIDERFPGNLATISNNKGDYSLNLLNQNRIFYYYVGQLTLQGKFDTGPIQHSIIGGLDYLDVDYDYDYQPLTANGRPTSTPFGLNGNLYSGPVPDWGNNPAALAFQRPPNYFRYQEIRQRALYVSDTLKWNRFELLGGLRYTRYKEVTFEPVIADTFFKENSVTPIVALSYDAAQGIRVYASYVEALQRGGMAPNTALNFGESFGPITTSQYEAGVKVQRGRWNSTLAVFQSKLPAEFTAAPLPGEALGRYVRDGERRFRGVEFQAGLHPTPEWYLDFSLAYLDAIQTKAQTASLVGAQVPGAVKWRSAALVEYSPDYLPGFKVFGGVRYSGKAYGQTNLSFVYPKATVGDVGVSYAFTHGDKDIVLRAVVQNVTDKKYWIPNTGGTGLSAGAPRTFTLSVDFTDGSGSRWLTGGGDGELSGWYAGFLVGGDKFSAEKFDVRSRLNPALGGEADALEVKHKTGWDFSAVLGHDFGPVRGELEGLHQQADLKQVTLTTNRIPISDPNPAAGTYGDPSGTTAISAFMLNALLDLGGGAKSPWAFEAGGGVGLARVNSQKWRLVDAADPGIQRDVKTSFAWQAIAGVRRSVNEHLDLTLRYRFLDIPDINLFTTNANGLKGDIRSHSLLAGATVNF